MKTIILAFGFIFCTATQALETLSSGQLLALCQSNVESDGAVCTSYINGFLDGAFATDPQVAENVLKEMQ